MGRDAGAIDPQLSPDGTMVAFVVAGEIYVVRCPDPPPLPRPTATMRGGSIGGGGVDGTRRRRRRGFGGAGDDDDNGDGGDGSSEPFPTEAGGNGVGFEVGEPSAAREADREPDEDDGEEGGSRKMETESDAVADGDWGEPRGGREPSRVVPSVDRTAAADDMRVDGEGRPLPVRVTFGAGSGKQRRPRRRRRRSSDGSSSDGGGGGRFGRSSSSSSCCSSSSCASSSDDDRDEAITVTHGLADFVSQEEMDRYRGFWWHPNSEGILFARVDESMVPPYRITHQGRDGKPNEECSYEDHRYPFAGEANPDVRLGYVRVDLPSPSESASSSRGANDDKEERDDGGKSDAAVDDADSRPPVVAPEGPTGRSRTNWSNAKWFHPPPDASEYLARVDFLPDRRSACVQWQNRAQTTLVLVLLDLDAGSTRVLHTEVNRVWINLHKLFTPLPRPIHPAECLGERMDQIPKLPREVSIDRPLPEGSFSFLWASERTGYMHLYLYTYVPNALFRPAFCVRALTAGRWVVEGVAGVDVERDVVYVTGTYDSCLERHLYSVFLTGAPVARTGLGGGGAAEGDVAEERSGEGVDGGGAGPRRGFKQAVMSALSVGGGAASAVMKPPAVGSFRTRNGGAGGGVSQDGPHGAAVRAPSASIAGGVGGAAPPPPPPTRLTFDRGMHSVVLDDNCKLFVDTSSDLDRPTSVKVYALPAAMAFGPRRGGSGCGATAPPSRRHHPASRDLVGVASTAGRRGWGDLHGDADGSPQLVCVIYDAAAAPPARDASTGAIPAAAEVSSPQTHAPPPPIPPAPDLPPPELLSFPTSDGQTTLHAALYTPSAASHGPGPYPLICAVYGGPHVQRVNRSWTQCADMRAQRLRSLGFAVVKCDNRGSARRGLAFEGAVKNRLGRLEVLDQVTAVRQLVMRNVADPSRVGVYGWSYGGYLSAMCLCRAPDVFHVAVAGAPVTSWDGYDTHYTERYMSHPIANPGGYRESAIFDHVPNLRGKLMIVHGLIDENVHFRHTARLINRLVGCGKDYDLLIFPDERHSPRRLRDRIYMEQRISDYFVRNLLCGGGGGDGNRGNWMGGGGGGISNALVSGGGGMGSQHQRRGPSGIGGGDDRLRSTANGFAVTRNMPGHL